MMNRLDADVRELRSRQSIPRTLTTKAVQTALPGTRDVANFTVPANTSARWSIVWKADGTQAAPIVWASADVYDGTTKLGRYGVLDSLGRGYLLYYTRILTERWSSIGAQEYDYTIDVYAGSAPVNLSFKFFVIASCKGTLEITAV
ncbi:hypothetical protein [Curtobacterium sp. MCSS17_007]|uniref:hypothetical protein n=1 Tax=Curtobacterium sp. MCSS17_007 TaxID=2175646 RepID=UPI0011B7C3EC|nr:hypothetical protein [Curtobacterium sp. MCSS17_007]WIE74478.1 hypothetical protein DEJ22_009300 [Curtobacterium sp. MCSS17_007]